MNDNKSTLCSSYIHFIDNVRRGVTQFSRNVLDARSDEYTDTIIKAIESYIGDDIIPVARATRCVHALCEKSRGCADHRLLHDIDEIVHIRIDDTCILECLRAAQSTPSVDADHRVDNGVRRRSGGRRRCGSRGRSRGRSGCMRGKCYTHGVTRDSDDEYEGAAHSVELSAIKM